MGVYKGYQPNIFRAISGSLFSTAANWSRGYVPTGSDVADIRDNCVINVNRTIGSLIVQANFTASISGAVTLQIDNTINSLGHIICSGSPSIYSAAKNITINSLSPDQSYFYYNRYGNQRIAGATYYGLTVKNGNGAIKKLIGNLTVNGPFSLSEAYGDTPVFDLSSYNVVFSGSFYIAKGTVKKSNPGSIIFNGSVNGAGGPNPSVIDFRDGNPNLEFRGGWNTFFNAVFYSGKGSSSFTTNNQTIEPAGTTIFDGPVIVSGAITVTNNYNTYNSYIQINDSLNGTDPNSKFINNTRFYIGNSNITTLMRTGSFEHTGSATSVIGYTYNNNGNLIYNNYMGLYIANSGTKYLSGNTYVSSSLSIDKSSILDAASYDLTVSGSTSLGSLNKTGPGKIIFVGNVSSGGGNTPSSFDFSLGNPTVEHQNGWTHSNMIVNSGTGSWYFTKNNQSLSGPGFSFNGPLIVSGAISVTNNHSSYGAYIQVNKYLNGTDVNSVFVNTGSLYFGTSASISESISIGRLDASYPGNTVAFSGNYSGTSSNKLNTFYNLSISGTGIKTLGTSSYVSGSLSLGTNGFLECGSQDLIVSGNFTGINSPTMTFSKSGSGNLKFIGPVNFNNANFKLDGNPNVEFNNGLTLQIYSYQFSSGLGQWKFITNNQSINFGTVIGTISSSILISGPITVTHGNNSVFTLTGTLNGDNALSKFVNGNGGSLYLNTTSSIMSTGIFDITTNQNLVGYIMTSSYTIPYTNFYSLYYGGIGTKYLSGNTYISGGLSSNETSDLNLLTYDCTISGSTVLGYNSKLSKSGAGNILFIGNVSFNNSTVNFTGNPNVEIRNGLSMFIYDYQMISGTGTWKFTTNNQTIYFSINNTKFDCNFLISGPITVTNTSTALLIFSGSINGDDANSKLVMSTNSNTYYVNSATPMGTGILDVTSSLGTTFVYASGSQNIKGGTYRNLTMLSGTKTLQGNVSVLGTLNTGSGATLATINYNGFTLTNP